MHRGKAIARRTHAVEARLRGSRPYRRRHVRVVAEYPGGDHAIFLGQVVAMGTNGHVAYADEEDTQLATLAEHAETGNNKEPLAYYRGKYRHLTCDYLKPSLAK